MKEKANLLNTDFSVADAEYPEFQFRDGNLALEFVDWREEKVKLTFIDAVAVKWQEADSFGPEDRDDCTYEIVNSIWLQEHLKQRMIEPNECHRHFKLCFNACGVLEVLAAEIKKEEV